MIVRQLKQKDYDCLLLFLRERGQADAFGSEYRIPVTAAQERYDLHIRPDSRRKVYLLRAVRIDQAADGPLLRPVAKGLAAALLEVLAAHARLYHRRTQSAP